MAIIKKRSSALGLTLFGGIFLLVGIGFLIFGIGDNLWDWYRAQGWVAVPAQVRSAELDRHRGDDSTTYKARASYDYTYQGRRYVGQRIGLNGGSDNIGDWQRNTYGWLKQAKAQNRTIAAFVNPDNPAEAMLDRRIRWEMLGFQLIFVAAFGGFGGFIVYLSLRRDRDAELAEASTESLMAMSGRAHLISSGGKSGLIAVWAFAVIWNAISSPVLFAVPSELDKGNHAILIGLLFSAVGALLLTWAIRRTMEWRRFGKVDLAMDPFPGAIGGEMGGTIELRERYRQNHTYTATLSCLHVTISGSGKNRSRREKVVWQADGKLATEPSGRGTRLHIKFPVPADLPESQPPTPPHHEWRLDVHGDLPGIDFNRSFTIPMRRHQAQSRAREGVKPDPASMPFPASTVRVSHTAGGKQFYFPYGRQKLAALMMFAFGLACTGVPTWFLYRWFTGDGDWFMWIFILTFLPFAALLCSLGMWTVGNSLTVTASSQGLDVQRRFLGLTTRRDRLTPNRIDDIAIEGGMTYQTMGKTVQLKRLKAIDADGRKIAVGENIKGTDIAEMLRREMLGVLR